MLSVELNMDMVKKFPALPFYFQHYMLLAQGQTQGSTLKQCTNKTLTTVPFSNTYKENEVSPEVEAGVFARLKCMQP